jgi:hypothetical protein
MANLLVFAMPNQTFADSGIPLVSLHQRGLVLVRFWLLPPEFDQGKLDTLKLIAVLTSRIADARSDISDPSHAFNGSWWS